MSFRTALAVAALGLLLARPVTAQTPPSTLTSPNPTLAGRFGEAVAGVADLDGDAIGDLLVGAAAEDVGGVDQSGRVYVYSGGTGVRLRTLLSPNSEAGGRFGDAVASVPDADGDGKPDILVGASHEDGGGTDAGRAYLFSGATGLTLRTLQSTSPESEGLFGFSVAGVSDADGDGRGDLLVGAPQEDGGVEDSGRAYFFSGAVVGSSFQLESPDLQQLGVFGFSVAGVQAATADTRGGVLVGAPQQTNAALSDGRAYTFPPQTRTVTLAGPQGWRLLAVPLLANMADLLAETWTQGVPGGDVSDGDPSVFRYDETLTGPRNRGYVGAPDLRTVNVTGEGRAVYVYEDDDLLTTGVQGGFPKGLSVFGFPRPGRSVPFSVTFTPGTAVAEDGWNLIGNPFERRLDWDVVGWTKTNVDNTIYVYDPAASVYRTWNGTTGSLGDGVVAEFQGFWVKASAAGPELVAPPQARVTTPAPQAPLGPHFGLRLAGSVGGTAVSDDAFVAFVPGAAEALDAYDAYELTPYNATFASLYAEASGTLLDVEARQPLGGSAVFTLGAAAVLGGQAASGPFMLTWPDLSGVPAEWRLTLTDVEAGVTLDLRQQGSYGFALAAGFAPETALSSSLLTPPVPTPLVFDGADGLAPPARFILRVEAAAVATDGQAPADLSLAAAPNPTRGTTRLAYTLPAAANVRLAVYDALGREVAVIADGARAAGPHDVLLSAGRLAPGTYVVRLQAGATVLVRRLTVVPAGR
ncbi:MAG TPA: T9SS type A sorting domain-containing protein [Rubricoccaceae bacterium]|jgi:hypothetical protein